MPHVVLIGTADTKLEELLYLRARIIDRDADAKVTFIDVGQTPGTDPAITITRTQLLSKYASSLARESERKNESTRGTLLDEASQVATAYVQDLRSTESVHGIVAAGGSGNTSVAATVMRACPIGLPKLLVSTVASGDVAPIVGESDIALMYSVVDVAGLNGILRGVLDNAAAAIGGMAAAYAQKAPRSSQTSQRALQVGITMFGVTTPCVDAARQRLEAVGAEVYVFHATGTGGKAMERVIREGALDAVLDLTTTEVCDLLVGGTMSAGPDRLQAAAERGIPCIVSLGACDMVNFGAKNTVPDRFQHRNLLVHNSLATLMRTSKEESREVGDWIAEKLRNSARDASRIEVWIPEGGISMISTPGQPFHDTEADQALFDAVESGLKDSDIRVTRDARAINDEQFATAVADGLMALLHTA